MNIGPTVAGGFKLAPETEGDWMLLLGIAADADDGLAKRLGGLMDEDSMWNDIVVPELESDFSKQRLKVLRQVMLAKENDEDVHILPEQAEAWYGALNQASLALEEQHQIHSDAFDVADQKAVAAMFRQRFYSQIQQSLLEFVMKE